VANDSSTGGFLPGTGVLALADDALDDLLQATVAGITGIDGSLVRPRWQPVVPKQPEPGTDWCAIGITQFNPMDYPSEVHDGTGDGSTTLTHWEEFTLLASLYGPHGNGNARCLRDGLYLAQNREAVAAQGIDLVSVDQILAVPDLVNEQWVKRYDVPIRMRASAVRLYPILNLLSADDSIVTDNHP